MEQIVHNGNEAIVITDNMDGTYIETKIVKDITPYFHGVTRIKLTSEQYNRFQATKDDPKYYYVYVMNTEVFYAMNFESFEQYCFKLRPNGWGLYNRNHIMHQKDNGDGKWFLFHHYFDINYIMKCDVNEIFYK